MFVVFRQYLCRSLISEKARKVVLQEVKSTNLLKCLNQQISSSSCLYKRRKTAEERKASNIIEYAPKKSNKIATQGTVDVWRNITVQELSVAMDRSIDDVQEAMLYVKGAEDLNPETKLEDIKMIKQIVTICGMKMRIIPHPDKNSEDDNKDRDAVPRPLPLEKNLKPRPPVVTVMGHVDHGKTTLLDSLRGSAVAASEAGGITQHIGAFTVTLDNDEQVTFLDTPGHAAFSAMRARGAYLTDIIVLVVAADDGVMAQTKEVIKLAQDADVPIIVAINKIDKPEADIERTKKDLMKMGIILEEFGGEIQAVPISALEGKNLKLLTEAITTQATLMGLKAEYTGLMEGVVVESRTDATRGKLSTAIVTRGTLRKGCVLVSGLGWAKVRALFDHNGTPIESATPGFPTEVLGWRELPFAGELILEVESEKRANSVIKFRQAEAKKQKAEADLEVIRQKEQQHIEKYLAERERRRKAGRFKMRPEGPRQKLYEDDGKPHVNVIIKGDVHGSIEAILDVLETYDDNERCRLDIVHYGVGDVNDGDMELAKTFNAIIYAFSVNIPRKPPKSIKIKEFKVIYHLVDDIKEEISNKLAPVEIEDILGEANVLKQFDITEGRKEVPVAGCRCTKGVLKKNSKFRLVRNGEILYDGTLESMRHIKSEVDSIKKDVECGLRLKDSSVVPAPGDTIVCYTTHLEHQKTDWDPGF